MDKRIGETGVTRLAKAAKTGPEKAKELALEALAIMEAEFGRPPREGYFLARTIFGKVFEEREGTPYTCSPRSETYWCS